MLAKAERRNPRRSRPNYGNDNTHGFDDRDDEDDNSWDDNSKSDAHIIDAMNLYMDIIQIFINLMVILAKSQSKKERKERNN